jgi:hypothetical protein
MKFKSVILSYRISAKPVEGFVDYMINLSNGLMHARLHCQSIQLKIGILRQGFVNVTDMQLKIKMSQTVWTLMQGHRQKDRRTEHRYKTSFPTLQKKTAQKLLQQKCSM